MSAGWKRKLLCAEVFTPGFSGGLGGKFINFPNLFKLDFLENFKIINTEMDCNG
jgi:hypothetical protein